MVLDEDGMGVRRVVKEAVGMLAIGMEIPGVVTVGAGWMGSKCCRGSCGW
jgi:hypothetical protein